MSINIRTKVYHPDYGLGDEYRVEVLQYVVYTSTKDAAQQYGIHTSTIYRWKRDMVVETPR